MTKTILSNALEAPLRACVLALAVGLALAGCAGGDSDSGGEAAAADTEAADTDAGAADAGAADAGAADASAAGGGLLNPNLAGEAELAALPGLTDEAVAAILEGRPFLDMVSLDRALEGRLDGAAREIVYGAMWVPIDLNTASEEEILLIPGVGDRMLHEFKEYRPYESMEQFRREIGKYVDDGELDRLVRYVTLGGS